jgi:site-specific recombinase XerD
MAIARLKYEKLFLKGRRYHVTIYDPTTKTRTTRSTRSEDLETAVRTVKRWEKLGEADLSWDRAFALWNDVRGPKITRKRLETIRWAQDRYWSPTMGEKKLWAITKQDIDRSLLPWETKANTTYNQRLGQLRGVWSWLVDEKLALDNPSRLVKRKEEPIKEVRVYTPEQYDALREAAISSSPVWFHPFLTVLYESGIRWGMLLKIHRIHVRWESKYWQVPAELMKVPGNGSFVVPMSEDCREALDRLHRATPDHARICGVRRSDVEREWRKVVKTADLRFVETPKLHWFRKTFVTDALERGVEYAVVLRMIHSRHLETLISNYEAVTPEKLGLAMAKMGMLARRGKDRYFDRPCLQTARHKLARRFASDPPTRVS